MYIDSYQSRRVKCAEWCSYFERAKIQNSHNCANERTDGRERTRLVWLRKSMMSVLFCATDNLGRVRLYKWASNTFGRNHFRLLNMGSVYIARFHPFIFGRIRTRNGYFSLKRNRKRFASFVGRIHSSRAESGGVIRTRMRDEFIARCTGVSISMNLTNSWCDSR